MNGNHGMYKDLGFVKNQLICGDCSQELKKLPNESIDLILTSPPYYNAKNYSSYQSLDEYMSKLNQIFIECLRLLKPSRMCIVNISPIIEKRESRQTQSKRIPLPFYFVPMMEQIGFEFLEDIIWKKPEGAATHRGIFARHRKPIAYKPNIVTEYILVFKKPADFLIDKILKDDSLIIGEYERTNVWEMTPETRSDHPAPFPEKLAENCIKYYSYENDLVLDPFAGSGTTLKMAKLNNRNYIGIEISQEYCEIINKRLEKYNNESLTTYI